MASQESVLCTLRHLDHVVRVWINHPGRRVEALEELAKQLKALLFVGIVEQPSG